MSVTERRLLSSSEVEGRLSNLPQWHLHNGRLRRELVFDTFEEAWGFLTSAALIAAARDHHPEFQNVFNRVRLELWTHDAGGLTTWDFDVAEAIEHLLRG